MKTLPSTVVAVTQSSTGKKIINGLLIAAGGYLVYRIGKKVYEGYRKNSVQHQAADDPNVRLAMGLRSAMNPSGVAWMMSFDTTNLSKLFEYAGQITNLNAVQNAYKDLYQDNLLDDVQKELNNDEYQKFLTLVTSSNSLVQAAANGKTSTTPVKYANAGELVVAKVVLNVRSSPDASYSGALREIFEGNKNIVRTAKKGDFIGFATGRQEFDVKNNVKFIEVGFKVTGNVPALLKPLVDAAKGNEARLWVSSSASYVDKFATVANMLVAYPANKTLMNYVQPPVLSTLKGLDGRKPTAVSLCSATVLDERFKPINRVNAHTLLGECVMGLKTNSNKEYIKFRTAQGAERWIDKQHINIIDL